LVRGSRFTAWLRSGNLRGSRRKKTGVLLPTRSQLLHGKAKDIPLGIGCAAFAGNGGTAQEHVGLLADRGEYLAFRITGDVVGNGESAESGGAFGVHTPLGDHLTVKMGRFLEKPDVLEQSGAARSSGHRILIVGNRCARAGCYIWWPVTRAELRD